MITQLTPLILRRDIIRYGGNTFAVLHADFSIRHDNLSITVPAGFPTDLASVPRAARWVVSKVTGVEASVIHDWLYDQRIGTRGDADNLFYEFLKQTESRFIAWIMYRSVRLGGGFLWDEGTPWQKKGAGIT